MATKKQIIELAEQHGIRVDFDTFTDFGWFTGETHLTMPDNQTVVGGATGFTIIADGNRSKHMTEVMKDLREMIRQLSA